MTSTFSFQTKVLTREHHALCDQTCQDCQWLPRKMAEEQLELDYTVWLECHLDTGCKEWWAAKEQTVPTLLLLAEAECHSQSVAEQQWHQVEPRPSWQFDSYRPTPRSWRLDDTASSGSSRKRGRSSCWSSMKVTRVPDRVLPVAWRSPEVRSLSRTPQTGHESSV